MTTKYLEQQGIVHEAVQIIQNSPCFVNGSWSGKPRLALSPGRPRAFRSRCTLNPSMSLMLYEIITLVRRQFFDYKSFPQEETWLGLGLECLLNSYFRSQPFQQMCVSDLTPKEGRMSS